MKKTWDDVEIGDIVLVTYNDTLYSMVTTEKYTNLNIWYGDMLCMETSESNRGIVHEANFAGFWNVDELDEM